MHNRTGSIFLTGCLLLFAVLLTGYHNTSSGKALTPAPAWQTQIPLALSSPYLISSSHANTGEGTSTSGPSPLESANQRQPHVINASGTRQQASPTPEITGRSILQYPGPEITVTQLYPGPQETETQPFPSQQATATPTVVTITPSPTRTTSKTFTPTSQPSGTVYATPSPTLRTGTPVTSPTELPPSSPLAPPPAGSNVSIWYSWNTAESEMLGSVVQSFQKRYPDVTFDLRFVPLDVLYTNYQEAAYLGQGPSLLLGPAQWGPTLYQSQLVTDLTAYVPINYLSSINQAALASGRYHGALISLPLSQHGVVMFRNTALVPRAPRTFAELSQLAHEATHSGNVGSYLERGAYFSTANILGLGGSLMDNNNMPVFNDLPGLDWINLLRLYDDAGAVTFNTNLDLNMFKLGRVGMIIDGTWNINTLRQILGDGQLAIDPWPATGEGRLTGWVEADSIYLNPNVTGDSRFAALAFIGYLLDPNVQLRLAEVGHIPSVMATHPRDFLLQEALDALSGGVPYPIDVDENILNTYFAALNIALKDVLVNGVSPEDALKSATDEIYLILINSTTAP